MSKCLVVLSVVALLLGGCGSKYVIVEPKEIARIIDAATDSRFTHDGVEYVAREVDGQLILRIVNTTQQPIEILTGGRVMDPAGVAHLIDARVIEPNQSSKFELPPTVQLSESQRLARSIGEPTAGSVDGPVYRGDNRQQPVLRTPGQPKPAARWSWNNNGVVRVAMRLKVDGTERSVLFVIRKEAK
jgi:hypothetical protein